MLRFLTFDVIQLEQDLSRNSLDFFFIVQHVTQLLLSLSCSLSITVFCKHIYQSAQIVRVI